MSSKFSSEKDNTFVNLIARCPSPLAMTFKRHSQTSEAESSLVVCRCRCVCPFATLHGDGSSVLERSISLPASVSVFLPGFAVSRLSIALPRARTLPYCYAICLPLFSFLHVFLCWNGMLLHSAPEGCPSGPSCPDLTAPLPSLTKMLSRAKRRQR